MSVLGSKSSGVFMSKVADKSSERTKLVEVEPLEIIYVACCECKSPWVIRVPLLIKRRIMQWRWQCDCGCSTEVFLECPNFALIENGAVTHGVKLLCELKKRIFRSSAEYASLRNSMMAISLINKNKHSISI